MFYVFYCCFINIEKKKIFFIYIVKMLKVIVVIVIVIYLVN